MNKFLKRTKDNIKNFGSGIILGSYILYNIRSILKYINSL